ncbi:MAG: hypothetical protein MMC33_005383 [Icmadophila ericetorum]|nr:hypothetical protein [Icmadophila ericetorum]
MSSPSSSDTGKRKRNAAPTSVPNDLLQPSSRDASGEDADDSATRSSTTTRHKKSSASIDSSNPPAKRPRTRSSATKDSWVGNGMASINKEDPGEPSDTTEASTDIATRSTRKSRSSLSKEQSENKVDVEDSKKMPPPAKAGLQDPVGYHTNLPPKGRPVRIYADGVFDLFHLGHMRQLEQAKNAFPEVYLLVGVTGDSETHKRKGLTVLTGAERAETVRHCKWVDEVIPNCPWIVTAEFLAEHKIDYVAHDDLPYGADEGDDIYKPIKEKVKSPFQVPSSYLTLTGIVRDYEKYIARQFKRGTSRQELNVSWLKKNELDLKRHVIELRDSIRSNWTTTGQELTKELRQFWQSSRPPSPMRGINRSLKSASSSSLGHLPHLELPRHESPGGSGASSDFATGYSLGLIGGVRSWMTRSRTSLRDSQPGSPDSEEDSSDTTSPKEEHLSPRGRKGQHSEKMDTIA